MEDIIGGNIKPNSDDRYVRGDFIWDGDKVIFKPNPNGKFKSFPNSNYIMGIDPYE